MTGLLDADGETLLVYFGRGLFAWMIIVGIVLTVYEVSKTHGLDPVTTVGVLVAGVLGAIVALVLGIAIVILSGWVIRVVEGSIGDWLEE